MGRVLVAVFTVLAMGLASNALGANEVPPNLSGKHLRSGIVLSELPSSSRAWLLALVDEVYGHSSLPSEVSYA